MLAMNKKARIIFESDISCGGDGSGGPIDSTIYHAICTAINAATTAELLPAVSNRLDVRDDLLSAVNEHALYLAAYHALGIRTYQVIGKEPLPFSDAIGAYRLLQEAKPGYMEERPGLGNCDGFEVINYKDAKKQTRQLYHHYIEGDGGSVFFLIE